MKDTRTLYFAYGSNLSRSGMKVRCPNAKRLLTATLADWRLTFRGVADIEPSEGDTVHGGLWLLTDDCVATLDEYEGAPNYYEQVWVDVLAEGGKTVRAMTYVMCNQSEVGLPSPFYLDSIVEGYDLFGLDRAHLRTVMDRLRARHEKKGVEVYVPRGPKRLMAVLPRVDDGYDELSGMTPATRRLYELEAQAAEAAAVAG